MYYGSIDFEEVLMKCRYVLGAVLLALSAVTFTTAFGQQAGFQAGIARPSFGSVPPHATGAPIATARAVPTVVSVVPVWSPVALVPTFTTVIVPASPVLMPGQTFFPGVASPAPAVVYPTAPLQPAFPVLPAPRTHLPYGTPRAEVLRVYGQPLVTVITSAGETLHFSGGVTIIIQNGQVAGPR